MNRFRPIMTAGAISALSFSFAIAAEQQGQGQGQGAQEGLPQLQQQQDQQIGQDRPGQQEQQIGQDRPEQEFGARLGQEKHHKATELKGKSVTSQDGERLGQIEDVAVNLETGEISFILVSNEENGDQWTAVPSKSVQIQEEDGEIQLTINIDQEQWQNAPKVSEDEIAQLGQEQRAREIYQHFGEDYEARQQEIQEFAAPDRDREQSGLQQQQQHGVQQQDRPGQQQRGIQQQGTQRPGVQQQQPGAQQEDRPGLQQQGQRGAGDEFGARGQGTQQEHRPGMQQQSQRGAGDEFGARERGTQPEDRPGAQQQGQREQAAQQQEAELQPLPGLQDRQGTEEFGAAQREGKLKLGSKLMEAQIDAPEQEKAARISDLLLNVEEGIVDMVLIESDYVDGTFAVSPQAFEAVGDDRLKLNVSQDDLQQAQELRHQQVSQHAQQARTMGAQQVRQNPQVFRLQEEEDSLFGAPGRERDADHEEKDEDKDKDKEEDDGQRQAY